MSPQVQLAPVPHAPSRPPSPSPPRASARTAARALSVLIMDSEIETINSAWLDSVETGKSGLDWTMVLLSILLLRSHWMTYIKLPTFGIG